MSRLARLCAAAALTVGLSACGAGEGPTQPDIEREAPENGAGLYEEGATEDRAPEPEPGQSPVEEPTEADPGTP